jgi:hypothetical protein
MAKNYYPVTSTSDSQAVGAASAQFSPTMEADQVWMFISTTNCWIAQGTNPTAAAADGNMFVPANVFVMIDGGVGAKLAVIQASAGGTASLTRCKAV